MLVVPLSLRLLRVKGFVFRMFDALMGSFSARFPGALLCRIFGGFS